MTNTQFLGNKNVKDYFNKAIKDKNFHHAYLFFGQEGIGKRTLALDVVRELLGGRIDTHPDFFYINTQEAEISIGRVRELKNFFSLTSSVSDYKIAVVNDAHKLNKEASNAFLKLLEEPHGKSVIILITHSLGQLPKTVISRAMPIFFKPLTESEITEYLVKKLIKDQTLLAEFVSLANGSIGRASELIKDSKSIKNYRKNIEDLMQSKLVDRFEFSKNVITDRDSLKKQVESWLLFFHEDAKAGKSFIPKSIFSLLDLYGAFTRPELNIRYALESWLSKL